jgi:dTDP-4-dehydrorhamnose reductase
MKIVLIGKNGQLGREFQLTLPRLGEVISLGREELDVSNLQTVSNILISLKPNLIINASAYTEVDLAEKEVDTALKINATAPGVMAEAARKVGAVLIHYSTDYVFNGKKNSPYTESDPTNPLNVYGNSKLAGEENVKQAGGAYLILRTSWIYSLRGHSFVNKVLKWAHKNKSLKIVSDQIGSPTWAKALAEITNMAIAASKANLLDIVQERRGIYHLAGSGYTSRYEWAKQILANDPNRTEQLVQSIEPVSSEEFPTPALRPLFTALNCAKFEESFGLRLPNWDESLQLALIE